MKNIVLLACVLILSGCQDESLEAKKEALIEKQKELAELQAEIKNLRQEIDTQDTSVSAVERTPVQTRQVSAKSFSHYVELTATVDSKENILVSAETNGRVVSIPAREGMPVKKGEVLVRLDDEAVRNQYQEAQAAYELAEKTFGKRQNLWDQKIGSEIEYLQAKNAYETAKSRLAQVRTQLANTQIKAPINGTVDNLMINRGEFVSIGSPIARVVGVENVHLEAELSEEYLPRIEEGDTALVNIPALGVERKAPISFVSQVINPENRSFRVRVELENSDRRIKPNALARMRLRDYYNDSTIVVPSKSISKDLRGDFVFVVQQEDGQAVARKSYVERGKVSGSETEITAGLEPGDQVVTSGYNQISEGSPVEVR